MFIKENHNFQQISKWRLTNLTYSKLFKKLWKIKINQINIRKNEIFNKLNYLIFYD
jgi:hypothetical protein